MLPSWFPAGLAARILNVGKSINFIRRTCNDTEWLLDVSDVVQATESFEYGKNELLLKTIASAEHSTNARLLKLIFHKVNLFFFLKLILDDIIFTFCTTFDTYRFFLISSTLKYHLLLHLSAIKRYLLLGQGKNFLANFGRYCFFLLTDL